MSGHDEATLSGIDGGNPLGFLAALGTLRCLTLDLADRLPRMGWVADRGSWRPLLRLRGGVDAGEVAGRLAAYLKASAHLPAFDLGDDIKATPSEYRDFATDAADAAEPSDRTWADFAAAFACEATVDERGKRPLVQDTALRTMSGAGHQHFLAFMRDILDRVEPAHVEKSLFSEWRYDDPIEKSSLRWDPLDDVRYALRARNPSGDPQRKRAGTVLGANALAIHALPLLPTAPVGRTLRTTGFRGSRSRDTYWTWPIWEPPVPLDVVASVLALPALQKEPPPRDELEKAGIIEVYRSRRLTTGKYRNFTAGTPVAAESPTGR